MQDQARAEPENISVVLVPFPSQGHLNQLLDFAIRLSSRGGLSVHFATSSTHNRQVWTRLQGWDPNALDKIQFHKIQFHKIQFHDLPFPSISCPSSDPNSPNKFPLLLIPTLEAWMELQDPLSSLFRSLSTSNRRLVIVYDPLMPFACSGADELPNTEAYANALKRSKEW